MASNTPCVCAGLNGSLLTENMAKVTTDDEVIKGLTAFPSALHLRLLILGEVSIGVMSNSTERPCVKEL